MLLESVFRYRSLVGKSDLGVGLEWDEIEEVACIEHAFASERGDVRRFTRHEMDAVAMMRGDEIHDRVSVVEIGPGGLVCANAPFIARGELVEIVIDDAETSYRFIARGVWLTDEGMDYRVGLRFVGIPVQLHKVQISEHTLDVVDRIGIAA